ncbi:hypothetical protein MKY84_03335 [Chryseomicrobium sp. FSL W7-1435]|uniref:hypothetical protein n=1 Tax=Chryseomicrobium sp. FSL W7-1435 TaxID=2921704 RepID=UPI003159BCF0
MLYSTDRVHHPALKPIAQELRQLANSFESYAYEEAHFSSAAFHRLVSEKTKELALLIRHGVDPVLYAGEVVRGSDGCLYIEDTTFCLESGLSLTYWSQSEQRHIPSRLAYYNRLFLVDRPQLQVEGLHIIVRK